MLLEVFIKLIVVLATYLEENNVLLRVFSSAMNKLKTHAVDQMLIDVIA